MAVDPKELHHEFVVETTELLEVAEGILLTLENNDDLDQIHALFRAMHTIKGTSAFLGFTSLSETGHAIESLLDGFRARRYAVTRPVIDLMLLFIDATRAFIQLLQLVGADRALKQDFNKLGDRIRNAHRALETGQPVDSPADASTARQAAVRPGSSASRPAVKAASGVKPAAKAGGSGVIPAPPKETPPGASAVPPPAAKPAAPGAATAAAAPLPDMPDDLAQLLNTAAPVDVKWALPWEKGAGPVKLAAKTQDAPTVVGAGKGSAQVPATPGTGSTPVQPGTGSTPAPTKGSPNKAARTGSPPAAGDTAAVSATDLHTLSGPTVTDRVDAAPNSSLGVDPAAVGPALEKRDRDTRIAGATNLHDPRRETQVIEHTFRAPQRGSTKVNPLNRGREGADTLLARATLRVDAKQIDELINLVGEMVLGRNRLVEATSLAAKKKARRGKRGSAAGASAPAADSTHISVDSLSRELVESLDKATTAVHKAVMRLRMVSLDPFFQRFPRLVHDLSGQLNKMIRLEIAGENTELDKSVVEAISEPLVHLVRNAAYHGIETPDERVKAGKPRSGTIFLSARPEGESVAIMIEDDGRGLDIRRIAEKAVRVGLLTAEQVQRMPPQEIIELVFLPGFSTEDKVGAISGRGVGLDVVRDYISLIGGSVSLSTEYGSGTRITLNLPMTLAILRALLVEVNGMTFAVPLSAVRKTRRLRTGDARQIHGQWIMTDLTVADGPTGPQLPPSLAAQSGSKGMAPLSALRAHRGSHDPHANEAQHAQQGSLQPGAAQAADLPAANPMIPLCWADQGMGFVRPHQPLRPLSEATYAVLIGVGGKTVAWAVDKLLGQEDIVAKSLPAALGPVPGLAGATIASDGATILIADVSGFTTQVES